jgi:hypothetical protein
MTQAVQVRFDCVWVQLFLIQTPEYKTKEYMVLLRGPFDS